MWKVMRNGTIGATLAYLLAGIFGYATFADDPRVKFLSESIEYSQVLSRYHT
jgi:amino acid permease